MRQVGTRGCLVNMECTCLTHESMSPQIRNGCGGQVSLFPAGVLGFCDSKGHVEPAVSVRPCLERHECSNLLNVCPVVEDEVDDDVMDDNGGTVRREQTSERRTQQGNDADIERTTRA